MILYVCSLGIDEQSLEENRRGIRLEAVHCRGVEDMKTPDVFQYFTDFKPRNVEWIDDVSCMSLLYCSLFLKSGFKLVLF